MRHTLLVLACLAILACLPAASVAEDKKAEEGFTPLFNGKDMSGFEFTLPKGTEPAKVWTVKDGVIVCTGKPNGYFYTSKSYGNYVLRLDFRYPEGPGNSGYLIHITGDHKVWPKCVEVQGQYGNVCHIFAIGGAKGPQGKTDAEARNKVRKPNTEWNTVEITSKDGTITASLNGTKVSEGGPYDVKEGQIGFQSEGKPIEFRNIAIKELK